MLRNRKKAFKSLDCSVQINFKIKSCTYLYFFEGNSVEFGLHISDIFKGLPARNLVSEAIDDKAQNAA